MMSPRPSLTSDHDIPIGFREFVALMAALMSLNALSIDPMLPALPAIGEALRIVDPNHRQWIIVAFFLGGGIGSLIYGSLSDRYGRRPVILISLSLMLVTTLLCAIAKSFVLLLAARFASGFLSAAMRVLTVSIVRDRFAGDRMARVMSLIFMVFIIVPMLAPAMGQAVMLMASWRWIFGVLVIIGGLVLAWTALRLPETLRPENRVAIDARDLSATVRRVVTHRQAFAYMIAAGVLMSALVTFVTSVQQIMFDVFHVARAFPLIFASLAGFMAIGSFFNQRLVERLGARRLAQGALIAFILLSTIHLAILLAGLETLLSFCVLQALSMLSFALSNSNLSAISMEPFAKGAGMAASFQAFLISVLSAGIGGFVAAQFDGSPLPMVLGYIGFGTVSLALIAFAEQGKLFTRPQHSAMRDPAPPA